MLEIRHNKIKKNKLNENLRSKFSFLLTTHYSLLTNKGFSLIELVVVVAILTIITSVVLFNQSLFNSNVVLENLAYEIALTIRQSQFFGINVRQTDIGGGSFEAGYGAFFDIDNPTSFIFFADIDNDNKFDNPGEIIETYSMTQNNYIKYLCADSRCDDPHFSDVQELSIVFHRPDPNAVIKTDSVSLCGSGVDDTCEISKIYIGSPRDDVPNKIVIISSVGQISIGSE